MADDISRLVPDSNGYSVEDYFKLDGPYLVEYVGVYLLSGDAYQQADSGEKIQSKILAGLVINVAELFAQAMKEA